MSRVGHPLNSANRWNRRIARIRTGVLLENQSMNRQIVLLTAAAAASLAAATSHAAAKFEAQTIDGKIAIGYGLAIADMDGDGKKDILLADAREFVWYRNPGWEKRVFASGLGVRDNVCLAAKDVNGDGEAEVAVGANWNPSETSDHKQSGSVHCLIRPANREGLWIPIPLPHEPTVHRMRWVHCGEGRWALVVLPLHGRGNKNGGGTNGVKISAYLPPNNLSVAADWKLVTIDDSLHVTHNFDQHREGDRDVLLIGGKEAVLQAVPADSGNVWKTERLTIRDGADSPAPLTPFPGTGEIRFLNCRRGVFDIAAVEPFHGNALAVYSWVAAEKNWQRRILTNALNQGHALGTADFLGTGRDQIVVGWREPNAERKVGIKLFSDDGNGAWSSAWIDENRMACEDLKIADLDGDGKSDIIAAGRATKNVVIYWNRR